MCRQVVSVPPSISEQRDHWNPQDSRPPPQFRQCTTIPPRMAMITHQKFRRCSLTRSRMTPLVWHSAWYVRNAIMAQTRQVLAAGAPSAGTSTTTGVTQTAQPSGAAFLTTQRLRSIVRLLLTSATACLRTRDTNWQSGIACEPMVS